MYISKKTNKQTKTKIKNKDKNKTNKTKQNKTKTKPQKFSFCVIGFLYLEFNEEVYDKHQFFVNLPKNLRSINFYFISIK